MIVGTGTDIVETERIRSLISRYGDRFLARWFSPDEIAYCRTQAKPYQHFASRLAAKEATYKALRLREKPLCWKDIVVGRDADGQPHLTLHGKPRAAADTLAVSRIHLSLSHCDAYAIASVTAERDT
jgi:holo-[acyl-carrier protein] synthase